MAKDYFNTLVVVICSFLSGTSNTATISSRLKQLKWMNICCTGRGMCSDSTWMVLQSTNVIIRNLQSRSSTRKTITKQSSAYMHLPFFFLTFLTFSLSLHREVTGFAISECWQFLAFSTLFASLTICGPLSKTAVVVAVVAANPQV